MILQIFQNGEWSDMMDLDCSVATGREIRDEYKRDYPEFDYRLIDDTHRIEVK